MCLARLISYTSCDRRLFLLYSFLDLTFVPSAISLNAAMLYQALRGGGGRFGSVLTQVSAVEDGRGDIPYVVLTEH